MPSLFEWFGVRIAVASASASSTALADFASSTIWLSCPLWPTSRSCAVVSGTITMSSWSWIPFEPFDLSTPSTWNVAPFELNRLAERVGGGAEEVLDDGRSDHGDAGVVAPRPAA